MLDQADVPNDLFAIDKRLMLKPVADFSLFLRSALARGPCACCRCIAAGGDQTEFEFKHTFVICGHVLHRRFARSAASDFLQVLSKAWLAYHKSNLAPHGPVDLAAVTEMAAHDCQDKVAVLMLACGLAKEYESGLAYQAVYE